jgi:hypothetical protein
MSKHKQDRSFYYFFAFAILSALCLGFLLSGCGNEGDSGVEYGNLPKTDYQWFSTTDKFTERSFRCIESIQNYAIWCYEETTP